MGETFKGSASVAGALGYSIEDVAVAVGLMHRNIALRIIQLNFGHPFRCTAAIIYAVRQLVIIFISRK